MPNSSFAEGSAIRVDVIVKNISKQELHVWKAPPQDDGEAQAYLSVEVRDSEGNSLTRIDGETTVRNGKKYVFPKCWMTRKGAWNAPPYELHDFLILNNLFKLSMPGV